MTRVPFVQTGWFAKTIHAQRGDRIMRQRKLTVIVNVKDGHAQSLKSTLQAAGNDVIGNDIR
jgi:hypothetical protein